MISYVGIAVDEPKRLERMHKKKNQFSLLEKYNCTEKMAYDLCKQYGLLSPVYENSKRNSCWFCSNQRKSGLLWLYKNHKELFMKLVELNTTPNEASEKWNRTSTITEVFKELEKKKKGG